MLKITKPFTFLFLLSASVSQISGADRADFLILSRPYELSILNHFEQTVADKEKKQVFIPYAPLQIIDKNTTLGDQITEALRFNYRGKTWHIQKNEKGNLVGLPQTYQETFSNCENINDTTGLSKSIRLYEKHPSSGNSFTIKNSGSVERIFKFKGSYYLHSLEAQGKYGWYSGPSTVFLQKKKAQKATQVQNDIVYRIESRLKSVNETYRDFFNHFNEITKQQKSIPEWNIEKDKSVIRCTLSGSVEIIDQLEKSTQYVVQEIKQILLGKPFTVDYNNGEITIHAD